MAELILPEGAPSPHSINPHSVNLAKRILDMTEFQHCSFEIDDRQIGHITLDVQNSLE